MPFCTLLWCALKWGQHKNELLHSKFTNSLLMLCTVTWVTILLIMAHRSQRKREKNLFLAHSHELCLVFTSVIVLFNYCNNSLHEQVSFKWLLQSHVTSRKQLEFKNRSLQFQYSCCNHYEASPQCVILQMGKLSHRRIVYSKSYPIATWKTYILQDFWTLMQNNSF